MVELGVFRGEFAKDIIQIIHPSELFLIDIWDGEMGSGNKDGDNYVKITNMKSIYLSLIHQTKPHKNIHVVRSDTVSFLKSCEENYFDAIYVDADHSEQAVYNDMIESFRVIRSGGYLMGHDYHHQIKIAVDKFCVDYKQSIEYITDDGCPSFLINIKK
jgi:hypothetical protein